MKKIFSFIYILSISIQLIGCLNDVPDGKVVYKGKVYDNSYVFKKLRKLGVRIYKSWEYANTRIGE